MRQNKKRNAAIKPRENLEPNDQYNTGSKFFHWSMAWIIVGLLAAGFFMVQMDFSSEKLQIYTLHKSFGILILALLAGRLLWKFASNTPPHHKNHAPWERALAKITHVLFYFIFFAMPLSGWLMSNAGGYPASFFAWEMPRITEKNDILFERAKDAHEILSYLLLAIVGLHIAGALKHHVLDGDSTLKRMIFHGWPVKTIPLVVMAFALPLGSAGYYAGIHLLPQIQEVKQIISEATEAKPTITKMGNPDVQSWAILPEKSQIQFSASQYGQSFTGKFADFSGDIHFDPDNLEQSSVEIKIDIRSIDTGREDVDTQAVSTDWFDVTNFPHAFFKANRFTALGTNRYSVQGSLLLRGRAQNFGFPFDLRIDGEKAVMKATLNLNRLDFGLGQGEWASDESVSNAIKVNIVVEAQKK